MSANSSDSPITQSPSQSSPSPTNIVLSKLSGPTNDFGLRFLEQLNTGNANKNVLFSPLSAILAYGMLLEGATGRTEQQIKEVLQLSSLGNQTSDVSQAAKKLLTGYKSIEDGSSGRNFSLAIGNLAMVNKNATLKETYARSLLANYFAQATNEDFENGTAVMNKLNSWISEKTFGKINKILSSPPGPETILMLINTVYFKGKWVEPFPNSSTIDDTFTNSDGTISKIKMMSIRDKKFNYVHNQAKKVKVVELPYIGNVSMIFIVPTESNTLSSLVPTLNSTELDNLLSSMSSTKLRVVNIPKFKLEDTHKLHEIFPRMGMDLPFSDLAQLPNIAENSELKVSQSIQKALIEVDEEGTVAAATTLIITVLRMSYFPAEDIVIDRPFLFMIRDNLSGVNLFMGQMNKMPNLDTPTVSTTAIPAQSSLSPVQSTPPASNQTTNSSTAL
ncbi:intracellular coagulation inhibitor 2-like isoform X2 [Panonychus citri]|nr:intracellular coagulation inhibitor 2-like isoform X2 [Panonychus citri]XP_053212626.1 intracellular coagulation inhibitor 2-like isoform X2 [Panonychus citri]